MATTYTDLKVAVLAGGVGAARFLRGLLAVTAPSTVTAIGNVGDDFVLHGLKICPDLDTVTYTLADQVNPDTGWGLRDESWQAMSTVERYGGTTWFRLGDRDLGTHLYRTQRLSDGATLHEVTAEIAASWGLELTLVPATNDVVSTLIDVRGGERISFQEYFVHRAHDVPIDGVVFAGIAEAAAAPGVVRSIADADVVIIAPSNPIVSIDPIVQIPEIGDAVRAARARVVAISPIVGGRALKGPAVRMFRELGLAATAAGVAQRYASLAQSMIVDRVDASLSAEIEQLGMSVTATDTIMSSPSVAAGLAREAIAAALRASR